MRTGAFPWPVILASALFVLGLVLIPMQAARTEPSGWTASELRTLRSLWIESLPPPPADPSNRVADSPKAAALGERLFYEKRLSADGEVACATCHRPELYFTDGRPRSQGIGTTRRGAPSLIGTAYSPWLYWDGRRDSHWSQALVPLEAPEEHGIDRRRVLAVVDEDPTLKAAYQEIFGPLPGPKADDGQIDRAFADVGKAIAAFERTLMPSPSRFDAYAAAVLGEEGGDPSALDPDEVAGLKLFIGDEAQCLRCHNGPMFTNFGFHNIGLIEGKAGVRDYDFGRAIGVREAVEDPFRCEGLHSDARPEACIEERFVKLKAKELVAAFKVPTLRNVTETAPYMHDGRFSTLGDVLQHYKEAPAARSMGFQQLIPFELTPVERDQLVAFLGSLTGPPPKAPPSDGSN